MKRKGESMSSYWTDSKNTNYSIPNDYLEFSQLNTDTLLDKNFLSTIEPTSYGFDFLETYRFLSIEKVTSTTGYEHEQTLAGTTFYFAIDGPRMIGFHYLEENVSPVILFADFETLNTMVLATSFTKFIAKMSQHLFTPEEAMLNWSHDKIAFHLKYYNQEDFLTSLNALEDLPDKTFWTKQMTRRFIEGTVEEQLAIANAVLEQVLYFKRKLPADWLNDWLSILALPHTKQLLTEITNEWRN